MRPVRQILTHPVWTHPITVILLAIAVGLGIHYSTTAPPLDSQAPSRGERTARDLPRPAPPREATSPASHADGGSAGGATSATAGPDRLDAEESSRAEAISRSAPPVALLPVIGFGEIWGYLMAGESGRWRPDTPITDLCLFNFRIDDRGQLEGELDRKALDLAQNRGARVHLVIASSGQKALLHFLLNPAQGTRDLFITQVARLLRRHPVDGLQLDFESLLPGDRFNFLALLRDLRAALPPEVILSLALPARTEVRVADPLRYRDLGARADRFLIMVYDEHWKGGPPGSISSRDWHDRVVQHALKELPPEKVVIGLPLYGRIWQREPVARATRFPELEALLAATGATVEFDLRRTHHFTFTREVTAEVWFDDAASLHAKFSSASRLGARSVGFWRLGQEDPRVWDLLDVTE